MGWKAKPLEPFQTANTITLSVWDIPLWDKARQIAIAEHMALSTLVYRAVKSFVGPMEDPEGFQLRSDEEYMKAGANWRVQRMAELQNAIKTGKKPTRKLSRTEEVYLETQKLLKDLGGTGSEDKEKPAKKKIPFGRTGMKRKKGEW